MRAVINFTILTFVTIVVPNSVSGLFWDFTNPTTNTGQAAAGGAFLGAAGVLSLCWLKGNCRGKRATGTSGNEVWYLDEPTFDYITRIDPSDCVRRLICDVSTGHNDFLALANILNLLPKQGAKIPLQFKKLSNQLKTAEKFGRQFKNVQACETTFKCPLSGYDFQEMMNNDQIPTQDNQLF